MSNGNGPCDDKCAWNTKTGRHANGSYCTQANDLSLGDLDPIQFKMIKDMTTEEIVDELISGFRAELMTRDSRNLRELLVRNRVGIYKDRTLREAGLREEPGGFFLGGPQYVEDDS